MKMIKSAIVAVAFLWALPAQAQSTTDIIFSEIEKRVIKDYFGVDPNRQTTQQNRMPDWAERDQARYDDNRDDDRNDNNDDDDDRGDKNKKHKKDKKNKGKSEGKSQGKSKGKSKDMPYGLSKRSSLPPGLQKQLDRNGRLPQGLAKRSLPADLQSKLMNRPSEQEVTIVNKDVVLSDRVTGVVLDVIYDVVVNGKKITAPSAPMTNTNGTLAAPAPQQQPQKTEPSVIDSLFKTIFGGSN